ncbi:DUF2993 domain-containing protein [Arthrobacter agilis]|uniref:LmeA family phospholipid-binding protein n=1 Tax=Arthrobacter agilis TaxID=37921 RepID=UPI000B34B08E|nr:LmeA family phospholipid-binding protein [Arthrobacter agilis]OUM41672.1 hypothetical protein B8W74_11165 [Arthrobacter agilis]PPB46373.1 DUF2993 domain-containing protein [Arthrobacter agilis]TPV26975.1 DUF2993 domain-containing protein [Arthrobacter agilis]
MTTTRAKDWLIGAVGMILLLLAAVAILWWAVSEPAGSAADDGVPPASQGADVPAAAPPAGLGDDGVWFASLRLDAETVVASGSTLRDVRAVGDGVVTGPDDVVAARLTVDATVPFDVVAEEVGDGSEVRAAQDGQAAVVRTVEAFGREIRVVATGTVDVENGRLVLEPRSIDVGGPDVLSSALAAVVRGSVTFEHEIEGLPEGLVLQDVVVREDGLRATLEGTDVALQP